MRALRIDPRWLTGTLLGYAAATAIAGVLARTTALRAATFAWLFLPAVLVVAIRWGRIAAVSAALLSDLLILVFAAGPLFSPRSNDANDYLRLAIATAGMAAAAFAVWYLSDRFAHLERTRAGDVARERAERRFQALIERSTDGIQLIDGAGRRVYVSPSYGRILGYPAEELQALAPFAVVHPDDRDSAARLLAEVMQHPGDTRSILLRARHADGSWRWLESTNTNLLDEPDVAAVVVNLRDVTEREETAQRLSRARDELATILTNVSDGIMVQDASGTLLYANQAAAELCDLPSAEVMLATPLPEIIGRFEMIDENGMPFPLERLPARRVLRGEERAEAVIGYRPGDGRTERWSLVTAAALRTWTEGTPVTVSVFRDITAQHRLQAAQREAIAVRDRLLSTAAHELNTPLTTIKAQLQLQLRRLGREPGPEGLADGLRRALAAADRLQYLIRDLLDVSRLTSGRMPVERVPLCLPRVVRQAVELSGADEDGMVSCSVSDEDVWVEADLVRLEQVLMNLLSNARKYSPEGAPITVTVRGGADTATVAVSDQGIGIPAADQQAIFDAFHRASNVEEGVPGIGLGLAIARDLVVAHGGELTVESTEGAGSTFTVTLPRIPHPEAPAVGNATAAAP